MVRNRRCSRNNGEAKDRAPRFTFGKSRSPFGGWHQCETIGCQRSKVRGGVKRRCGQAVCWCSVSRPQEKKRIGGLTFFGADSDSYFRFVWVANDSLRI